MARQTDNVDVGASSDADVKQPATDVIADSECNQEDRPVQTGLSVDPAPPPVSVVRLSNRCVLLTYFEGDVGRNVDEHFSRSLKAAAATRYDLQADDGHTQLCRRTASKYRSNSLHGILGSYQSSHFGSHFFYMQKKRKMSSSALDNAKSISQLDSFSYSENNRNDENAIGVL